MLKLRLLLLSVWFISPLALTQELNDLFTDARVMYESKSAETHYRIALSAPKKVNNRWVIEREERIQGKVTRRTLEMDSSYSFEDTRRRLDKFFKTEQGRLIYACAGLDCGSSNAWANEVFNVKQLYGLDAMQEYQVWELERNGVQRYAVSYLTQRGNKRIYLQLDWFTPASNDLALTLIADPKSIMNHLLVTGFYVVPGNIQSLKNNPHIEVLAAALKMRPMQKVIVVGHSYIGRDLAQKKADSLSLARALAERLVEMGVREGQVSAEGVGSLAPQGKAAHQRLELVIP